MKLDPWTFALQAINALVLIWLLARFLFRPVARIIAQRQAAAASVLDDANADREAARQEREAAERDRRELAAGREAALASAAREAAKARDRLLAAARSEADALRAQADADREARRGEARAAEERRIAELAVAVSGRLLERLPAAARVDGFVGGLCEQLGALPDLTRNAFLAEDANVVLATPRALTAEERAACLQAIETTLGRSVPIRPVVDPTLIAGLELRCDSVVVSNHLRDDLARVQQQLVHAADA